MAKASETKKNTLESNLGLLQFFNALGIPASLGKQGQLKFGDPDKEFQELTFQEAKERDNFADFFSGSGLATSAVDTGSGAGSTDKQAALDAFNEFRRRKFEGRQRVEDLEGPFAGAIQDFIDQRNPFADQILGNVQDTLTQQQGLFEQSADQLSQLISTGGSPVDVSALQNAGVTRLKEQFSTIGAGLGTDLFAAADLNNKQLQVAANEAGLQRLLQALLQGQTLGSTNLGAQSQGIGIGSDINRVNTEAGRRFATFQNLLSPSSPNPLPTGSDTTTFFPPSGGILGGIKDVTGALTDVKSLFGPL